MSELNLKDYQKQALEAVKGLSTAIGSNTASNAPEKITFAECMENATKLVDKVCPKPAPRLTISQRLQAWSRNRAIASLERQMADQRKRLDHLPAIAEANKRRAEITFSLALVEIDCLVQEETALANFHIASLKAKLEMMEVRS